MAHVSETEKVSITSMYPMGDVKLWWQFRLFDDASANRDKIEMWDSLKKGIERSVPTLQHFVAGKECVELIEARGVGS